MLANIGVYLEGKPSTKKHSMRQRFSQQQEMGISPNSGYYYPKKQSS